MPRAARPPRARSLPYGLALSITVVALVSVTCVFVLVVLPQRFALHAGLRESGMAFPAQRLPFAAPRRVVVRPPTEGVGPAERLWTELHAAWEDADSARALDLLERYLAIHATDWNVWRQYARSLAAAGRHREAAAALRRYVDGRGDPDGRRELARILRDGGDTRSALAAYRELLRVHPDDAALRLEVAQALAWAGHYDEAIHELRHALARAPDDSAGRAMLERVLHWAGRGGEAGTTPDSSPLPTLAADSSAEALARAALARGELTVAASWYRHAVAMSPGDPDLWLEWANVLQFRMEDPLGASEALNQRLTLAPGDPGLTLRLAQLHLWTGRTAGADSLLLALARRDDAPPETWRLLGDLRRWQGDRVTAARAYREVLRRDQVDSAAAEGLQAVRTLSERAVAQREPDGATGTARLWRDSDGFDRRDLGGQWTHRAGTSTLTVGGGVRAIRGPDASGTAAEMDGEFAEVRLARWWREATMRTAVWAGVERFDATGAQPVVGVALELAERSRWSLAARYERGPAHELTLTVPSVLARTRADHLAVSLYHHSRDSWRVWGAAEAAALSAPEGDNLRLGWALALEREIRPGLRFGLTSAAQQFRDPAPLDGRRRLYWDPELSWATGMYLELRPAEERAWEYRLRLAPALALIRERAFGEFDPVPQLGGQAGIGYRWRHALLRAETYYLLGRERGYRAYGLTVRASVTP